jgi:transposase
MRYELTDHEWSAIKPMLPNKPRGVPRVNDRRVLNGIFWVLRSGAPWRDLPDDFGPYTTCYNRFVRWRRAGVWGRIMDALATAHDASVQMIDTSIVRVHQHGACIIRNRRQSMGTVTRRADQRDTCFGRYQRPAGAACADGRGGTRQSARGQTAVSPQVRINAAGRSRLRCRLDQSPCREEGRAGQHSTSAQSQRADLLQPISVSSPQFGRAVLQQDQTLSPGRNALRQAGGELPRFRSACVDQAMAAR